VRPGWFALLLAAALATVTLSVLPFFEILSVFDRELTLRPAPRIVPPPPAPYPRGPRRQPLAAAKPRPQLARSRPRLEMPKQRIEALRTQLALTIPSLALEAGDFSLDFEVEAAAPGALPGGGEVPFRLSDLDVLPQPLMRLNPIYPRQPRRRGIEGCVELSFIITAEGRTADIRVTRSEPGTTFVEAAKAAVRRWRFTPPQKDGRAVGVRASQVIRFQLR
jgi:protein TonB